MRRLAIPAVGATLLQGLFNIIDMFWVGRGLGPAALAGVGTASFVVWAILSLAEMPAVQNSRKEFFQKRELRPGKHLAWAVPLGNLPMGEYEVTTCYGPYDFTQKANLCSDFVSFVVENK